MLILAGMRCLKILCFLFACHFTMSAQLSTDTIYLDKLPDTLFVNYFNAYTNFDFAYNPGQNYDPDTLYLYLDTLLISSISLPKTSVASFAEMITTPQHNGSGYEFDNGFGTQSDFGYYLKQNDDGSIQLNDWTQTISGDSISSASFGNQAPVEFLVAVDGQTDFLDPSLDTSIGELEVYVNGLRILSTEFTIDTTNTGIILNTGLSIGDNVIIDID